MPALTNEPLTSRPLEIVNDFPLERVFPPARTHSPPVPIPYDPKPANVMALEPVTVPTPPRPVMVPTALPPGPCAK